MCFSPKILTHKKNPINNFGFIPGILLFEPISVSYFSCGALALWCQSSGFSDIPKNKSLFSEFDTFGSFGSAIFKSQSRRYPKF